jgi:hypothetical protein
VEREYELFERLPDGCPIWRGHASGLRNAHLKLDEIARSTKHECFAVDLSAKEIVARLNVPQPRSAGSKPLVFQIGYDNNLANARTDLLRLYRYDVVSVIGNAAAKVVLSMPQQCDLFLIGHEASEETRKQMVEWLKANYAGVQILALHSPASRKLSQADYNVKSNGPKRWLRWVRIALGKA